MKRFLLSGLMILLGWGLGFAQSNEVEMSQNTMKGLRRFYVSVNLEWNKDLQEHADMTQVDMQKKIEKKLTDAGIDIIKQTTAADVPYLYLHVNMMDAGRGLVPFAITIGLYQPVKLTLNRDRPAMAVTWNAGNVGIVSYDQMKVIRESAMGMVEKFLDIYQSVNHR